MHHHDTDHDPADAYDARRHLISDRDLDQIAVGLEFGERALRGLVPDLDPLAQEIARLRAASTAFTAWRGAAIPMAWRRRETPTGTSYHRGGLRVVAHLAPRLTAGEHLLHIEISRRGGVPTLTDLLLVTGVFVDPTRVIAPGALDRHPCRVRVVELLVRGDGLAAPAQAPRLPAVPANDATAPANDATRAA